MGEKKEEKRTKKNAIDEISRKKKTKPSEEKRKLLSLLCF